jgi:hypothetical protein
MPVSNPWVILGVLLLILGAGATGLHFGKEYAEGKHAQTQLLIEAVREQAQIGAAQAIAANKPVHVHTKQVLDREVRIVPDYSRCVNSPDGLRAINAALENKPVTPSDSSLPRASPSD